MTTTAASHDQLAHAAWHTRQLTEPFTIATRQVIKRRTHWVGINHPALLDQLREAVTAGDSGAITETIRRRHRESSPPFYNETAAETLSAVYVGIALWHTRLDLPSPDRALDWQKAALRQLDAALQRTDRHGQLMLAPSIADDLAAAVEAWWVDTARAAGWRPEDLRGASPMIGHWTVNYPTYDAQGNASYWQYSASSIEEARSQARWLSRDHGHAIITNGAGFVATYVDGQPWTAPAAPAETPPPPATTTPAS